MGESWENWSGSVTAAPAELYHPEDTADLVEVVERHAADASSRDASIRAVGAGHSFTRLGETDDVLVATDRLTDVVSVDVDAGRATIRAGTRLDEMNEALAGHGLAMANLGDIDQQRLAGAMLTGTHGTGRRFGILATQIAGMELVTAAGEVRTLAPIDGDVFDAARVSLGALGLVSTITLDLLPAYDLEVVHRVVDLDVALERYDDLLDGNRHAEFFWWPEKDVAEVKTIDAPGEASKPELPGATVTDVESGPSHEVFPTPREIRFNEMEYGVPAEHGPAAMREIRDLVISRGDVEFPVEYRYVRGDEIPLSPAHGRDTVFVAVHEHHEKPYADFFAAAEEIFWRYDGRPHWGKHHTLTAEDLSGLYPEWETFQALREEFDPDGVFSNAYLGELLD